MVGWGGNNGSTLTGTIIANTRKICWDTRNGVQNANYFGSMVMSSTVRLGVCEDNEFEFVRVHDLVPMVHPNDLVVGGWDINSANLASAMDRAGVFEPDLKNQIREEMSKLKPLKSMYYPDFIAANQEDRADNLLTGSKKDHLEQIRKDIR